ncbi:uncharacterized protein MYCFIDRAFT_193043 [Pseudocercospora fijiensis CIRAD86]|uniref:Uncharacterized protein n=1 Tax=Pseudocercospora fijiensis (strain CIRAD86) TaxID=383855 RepID=N1QAR6_PSEFD|nr:uncharacterized protein MYCFIDRAFT_193043 [Pseudocercospora fijiensis CIRAD86]EME89026.1 hypothetical protein MYCFIDRAFT_193043 [Pseudocercospora fijiensis CIRAD86]
MEEWKTACTKRRPLHMRVQWQVVTLYCPYPTPYRNPAADWIHSYASIYPLRADIAFGYLLNTGFHAPVHKQMSQDLFAAFGEALTISEPATSNGADQNSGATGSELLHAQFRAVPNSSSQPTETLSTIEADEDDFGDFEDASLAVPTESDTAPKAESARLESVTIPPRMPPTKGSSSPFPPKAQKREEVSKANAGPQVGRHPFADHMDFLFSGGDDEYDAGDDDLEDLSKNPEAAMAYSKRMIAEQQVQTGNVKRLPFAPKSRTIAPVHAPAAPNPSPARNKLQKKSGYVPTKDPNVLFDVENISEHESDNDADFGDFEDAPHAKTEVTPSPKPSPAKLQKKSGPPTAKTQKATSKPSMPAIDLLGLSDPVLSPTVNFQQRHITQNSIMSPRSERVESILGASKADSMTRPPTAGSLWSADDEAWDDFDTQEDESGPVAHHSHSRTASSSILPSNLTPTTGRSRSGTQDALPPTNVPPPAILLSIFPSTFAAAQDALLGNLSRLDTSQRQQLLGHPATHQFLKGYLQNSIVLAHIVAGRKLRWKRDQILSQSMRIGPAAAGGKGGMKLNSIDKSEQTKEDREVTDVVGQWKAQLGKLRTAVTGASASASSTSKLPAVPDISETMAVKTLKALEGGFTAPHACALCGLKRDERVFKVDVDVDDSFGEWWINGMDMHVSCKKWWDENKDKLKSR